jgi:hypothetical protein
MLEIHQDAVPVPEEMQFKVQEQCSTSILQTTKPMRSGAFQFPPPSHPYGETPIISKEDSTKALLLQVTRKSIWFSNTLQMKSHFLIQP